MTDDTSSAGYEDEPDETPVPEDEWGDRETYPDVGSQDPDAAE